MEIHVWYGPHQVFGRHGHPQRWVNLLGNISGAERGVASLTYTLNGVPGPVPLSVGPDSRRLLSPGDFNVELDRETLRPGLNKVVISAVDGVGRRVSNTTTVEYISTTVWPLPYAIDWRTTSEIGEVVQIVDGRWTLDENGIRPTVMGYDRIVALGDVTWENHEVTAAITVHATDPAAYNPISTGPGMGLLMRWTGHTDQPVVCPQPHCGWLPAGAFGWYAWEQDGGRLYVALGEDMTEVQNATGLKLAFDVRCMWKMRVQTIAGEGVCYLLKVWPEGQQEPVDWLATALAGLDSLARGSFLFVAHHVDATLGNVSISRVP